MDRAWIKSITAPIVVGAIVGLTTGYMGSQVALATQAEQIRHTTHRVERLEAQFEQVRSVELSMARLEVEFVGLRNSTDRLSVQVERALRAGE